MEKTEKLSIVFLDVATLDRGDVSFERFTGSWDCEFHPVTSREDTLRRIEGKQAAVTNKVVFDAEVLASRQSSALKLIAIAATGTNNVDLEAARARGIAVCNVAGYSTRSVAQQTLGYILEFASCVGRFTQDIREGKWEKSPTFTMLTRPVVELAGKKLGIIGYGAIGKSVAETASALGMEILIAARPGSRPPFPEGRLPLDELLSASDFISIHCPLTPDTRGLIGAREFKMMKDSCRLINAARGGIVDETALVEALKAGTIAGAAVDVLTTEPPAPGHPIISAAKELDNLLVTPHTAWTALEARRRLIHEIAENIDAFTRGEIRNRVV